MKDPSSSVHVTVFFLFFFILLLPNHFSRSIQTGNRYIILSRLSYMLWRDDHTPVTSVKILPGRRVLSFYIYIFFFFKITSYFSLWLCKVIHHARPELKTHSTRRKNIIHFHIDLRSCWTSLVFYFYSFFLYKRWQMWHNREENAEEEEEVFFFFPVWDYW